MEDNGATFEPSRQGVELARIAELCGRLLAKAAEIPVLPSLCSTEADPGASNGHAGA